jgi:hypothetical protein
MIIAAKRLRIAAASHASQPVAVQQKHSPPFLVAHV